MDNKTKIIALSQVLHNEDRNFYSRDGDWTNYVHGTFNFYNEDIPDISKPELEALLTELEDEHIWKRKYENHPLVGKVIDFPALKTKILHLNPESIIEEKEYRGFKLISRFYKANVKEQEGTYYFQSHFIDTSVEKFNAMSIRRCKETIDHYYAQKEKIQESSTKIHVFEWIGGNGGGLLFLSEDKLDDQCFNTAYGYHSSFESFINEITEEVKKDGAADRVWME